MMSVPNQPAQISPGMTIGILGGGQLGRMMSMVAKQMGYRVHIFSPSHDSPAGQVSDLEFQAPFEDLEKVQEFAKNVDVVTVETENIPVPTLEAAAQFVPSYPGSLALKICQNRSLEKQFLVDNQIATCGFRIVRSLQELQLACEQFMPSVMKVTTGGYDGKGQAVIRSASEIEEAWEALKPTEAIVEEWIEYDFEFSVVGCRNASGIMTAYRSIRNEHKDGILDVSFTPSGLPEDLNERATDIVYRIMSQLESVGVLTVEFFCRGGEVLVNEIAPRPHNSGHLTIEGHMTSQFEQHIRSVCGLPMGSTEQHRAIAMANILGQHCQDIDSNTPLILSSPDTKLHLYGKEVAERNRKMGHLIALAETPELATQLVLQARSAMGEQGVSEQLSGT